VSITLATSAQRSASVTSEIGVAETLCVVDPLQVVDILRDPSFHPRVVKRCAANGSSGSQTSAAPARVCCHRNNGAGVGCIIL
jgi:hypothetical protein